MRRNKGHNASRARIFIFFYQTSRSRMRSRNVLLFAFILFFLGVKISLSCLVVNWTDITNLISLSLSMQPKYICKRSCCGVVSKVPCSWSWYNLLKWNISALKGGVRHLYRAKLIRKCKVYLPWNTHYIERHDRMRATSFIWWVESSLGSISGP